jgi:hypothetical protein
MIRPLPQFVHDLLANPPRVGEGVHNWLHRMSRQLHAHLPAPEIVALLESRVANCGRHVPRKEIEDAVKNSLACAWQPHGASAPIRQEASNKWPQKNSELVETICAEGYGLPDLWEASPIRIEDTEQHTEEIVDRLFPGNPLLCCGRSQSQFDTRPREKWRGQFADLQFIVPSPMTAPTGLTKDGRQSSHALSNTGPRRFLICEFDKGTTDEHAALLLHLAAYAPLVCAVHSGGKSLHGWFYVNGFRDEQVLKFFRYAVHLGADPSTWTRSQFVRMPDGKRDNGRQQTVFFLNFKPIQAAR